jgi:hypothetical protein
VRRTSKVWDLSIANVWPRVSGRHHSSRCPAITIFLSGPGSVRFVEVAGTNQHPCHPIDSSAFAACATAFGSSAAHSLHLLTYVARSGHVPFRATLPPHEALYAAGAAPRRSYTDERVQLREGTPRAQLGRRRHHPIKDVEAMMGHRCTRESLR